MQRKKIIIVIAIVLGVLLAVSVFLCIADLRSVVTFGKGCLVFVLKYWVRLVVPTLVGVITLFICFVRRLSVIFSDVEVSYVDGKITCEYPNLDFINIPAVRVYLKMHFLLWRSFNRMKTTQKLYEAQVNQESEENVSKEIAVAKLEAVKEAKADFDKRLAVLVQRTNFWAMKKGSRKKRGIFRYD